MEAIEKYKELCNKKLDLKVMLVLLGASLFSVLIIFLNINELAHANEDNLGKLFSLVSSLNFFMTLGLFLTIVSIGFYVFDFIAFKDKSKMLFRVMFIIANVIGVFYYFNMQPIFSRLDKAIKSVQSGNFFGGMASGASALMVDKDFVKLLSFVLVIYFIALIITIVLTGLYFKNNKLYTTADVKEKVEQFDKEKFIADSKQTTAVVKEKAKKHKVLLLGILAVILLLGSFSIYNKYFNKTKVDVIDGIVLEFDGVSGDGNARINVENITKTNNAKINLFLDNVQYSLNKSTGLSNGDVVQLTAMPNIQLMEDNKYSVKVLVKEFTVDGLDEVLEDVSVATNANILDEMTYQEVRNEENTWSTSYTYEYNPMKSCYVATSSGNAANGTQYGTYIKIYEVIETYQYTSFFGTTPEPTITTYYYPIGFTNLVVKDNDTTILLDRAKKMYLYKTKDLDAAIATATKYGAVCK